MVEPSATPPSTSVAALCKPSTWAVTSVGTAGTGAIDRPISSNTIDSSRKPRAETAAPLLLWDAVAGHAGHGELLPQRPVEHRPALLLQLLEMRVRRPVHEDLASESTQRLLVVGQREVHGYPYRSDRGILRPKMAMRSRWISLVPPPKVRISVPR